MPIAIPPLRERRDDIPELCEVFLLQAARDLKVPLRTINAAAMRMLASYDFPGNIRELKNLIERACILSAGNEIGPGNFPVAEEASGTVTAEDGGGPITADAIVQALPETFDLRALLAALSTFIAELFYGTKWSERMAGCSFREPMVRLSFFLPSAFEPRVSL